MTYRQTTSRRQHHWLYAGLATITVLGGCATAPPVMAKMATKNVTTALKKATAKQRKTIALTKPTAPKRQARSTIGYTFSRDDFVIDGTTIVSFTNDFFENFFAPHIVTSEQPWDGVVSFPTNMTDITSIGPTLFPVVNDSISSVDFSNLPNLTTLQNNDFLGCYALNDVDLSNNHKLSTIETDAFYAALSLKQITIGDLDGELNIEPGAFFAVSRFWDDDDQPQFGGGVVTPTSTGSALVAAQKIVAAINADNDFPAESAVWQVSGTVAQKFVDQAGREITQDNQGTAVTPFTTQMGFKGDAYALPAAPTIAGYGEPTIIDGTTSGNMTGGPQVVTYQYRIEAAPITIYRVDTHDQALAEPEIVNGYTDEMLDLTPKAFANYAFTALYTGTSTTRKSRTTPDLNWQRNDKLANTQLTYGDNAGHSYKFVYAQNAITQPEVTPETPTKLPSSGENSKPATKPVAKPKPAPAKLPGTGETNLAPKTNVTNVSTPRQATAQTNLPQAGNVQNRWLPLVGVAVLGALVGVLVFKRKSIKCLATNRKR